MAFEIHWLRRASNELDAIILLRMTACTSLLFGIAVKVVEHLISSNAGTPTLHWVGRAGHGRHGGGAPALCAGPLMSALILSSFDFVESLISYQEERTHNNAAID